MKRYHATITSLFVTLASIIGCAPALDDGCRLSRDCLANEVCLGGDCVLANAQTSGAGVEPPGGKADTSVTVLGEGADAGTPGASEEPVASAHPCADARAAGPGDLVVNEILAAVPTGAIGDANGDGIRDPYDDEFIELVNVAGAALDLSGVRVRVDGRQRFRFEPLCLGAGEAVVIFGGGAATLAPHVAVIVSETRLSLRNDGGRIEVTAREGALITAAEFGGAASGSEVLAPEVVGTGYVPHPSVAGGAAFSPGLCADGRPTTSGCAAEADDDPDAGSADAG